MTPRMVLLAVYDTAITDPLVEPPPAEGVTVERDLIEVVALL